MDLQLFGLIGLGFLAQMVDGALGMAYGTIASSTLVAIGTSPAIASATVHTAEIVTTGVSGASHLWHRNVDHQLFFRLVFAGIAGGVLGAYVLTGLPEAFIKPCVTIYLSIMSGLIIARLFGWQLLKMRPNVPLLGAAGGFLDAAGGGGWGPVVASTLIAGGDRPRQAIGSVNLAEFFVTLCISLAFLTQLDPSRYAKFVLGLIIGGVIAAPLAGYLLRVLPVRAVLIMVAIALTCLSAINLIGLFR